MGWVGVSMMVVLVVTGCANDPEAPAAESPSTATATTADAGLSLVAIGDSIPYNSADDCPGCTGFVDRYADAVSEATGKPVETTNLAQHTGLTLDGLLAELDSFKTQLSTADVIVIGIAHNSIAMNADRPCGATFDEATFQLSDWSKVDEQCAQGSAEKSRPQFAALFRQVLAWRSGEPTIIRTINKYNDWIGWEEAHLTPSQQKRTTRMHDVWNAMICATAEASEIPCADIYHAFNGPAGRRASGDLLAGDYTHPSDKGNEVIAEALIAEGFAPLS